jgi:hypothetical protein
MDVSIYSACVQATVDKLMDLRQAATDEGFELNVRTAQ